MSKWWQRSNTAEIKPIPWLSPAAILRLESLLTPDMRVLEHGSGGSTLWLASRVASVTSFEHDVDWMGAVQNQAPDNVKIVLASSITDELLYGNYDLLLIDGEPLEARNRYIADAPYIVKAGGIVVLDNANRPHYAQERKELEEHAANCVTVDANEPGTSFLVTDFFRMPK